MHTNCDCRYDYDELPYFYMWETPSFRLIIEPTGSLVDYKDIRVSFSQGAEHVDLHLDDVEVDGDYIHVSLSQTDTKRFQPGIVDLEVNILYDDGQRHASTWAQLLAKKNLYNKEMA